MKSKSNWRLQSISALWANRRSATAPGGTVEKVGRDAYGNRRIKRLSGDHGSQNVLCILPPAVEDLTSGMTNLQWTPAIEIERCGERADRHTMGGESKAFMQRFE